MYGFLWRRLIHTTRGYVNLLPDHAVLLAEVFIAISLPTSFTLVSVYQIERIL